MTSQENYTQCVRSELELFSTPPLQVAVEEGQWIEYNPVSSISSSAPIEFTVTGSGDEYIELNKTLLEVKAVIKQADGQQTPKTSHVAPINNTLQSLFSQVDVSLNDVPVSSSTTTYPYRAYIENHLNYGSDAKDSRLGAGLYFMDDNITQHDPIPTGDGKVVNSGLQARHRICTGQTFDMIGGVHADIFHQNRYLLNGVSLRMRMTRSKDSFVLMGTGDHTMEIVSAKLWMRKLKIAPSLGLAHEKMLTRKTAKYPLSRVEVKVFHLPAGQKSFTHDALFLGQLPKRVVLGIVDNRAFNGDLTLNPYEFKHCDLNFLSLHLDGQQIPWAPLKPSFAANNYVRSFFTQFSSGDGINSDTGNTIDREEFKDGHTLYCFDLTPDLSSSSGHHFNVTKRGNLRVEMGFEKVLPFTGNVIVYSEFESIIEIDGERKVTHDYVG